MSDMDYMQTNDTNQTSSSIGCLSQKSKIILSISIVAVFLITLIIIILVVTLQGDEEPSPEMDYSDFVIINDLIPEIITELRYYSSFNFVGEHIDGYEEPVALLTKEAAEKLKNASKYFNENENMTIKIWDSYRPQRAVDHFMRWATDESEVKMKSYFYPNLTKKEIFDKEFVAKKSGHSRGSTLDITLVYKINGTNADFGTGFDYFGDKAFYNTTEITESQNNTRKLLKTVMEENGFRCLPEEWWHFTLNNEPFPKTYFNFPVNATLIRQGKKKE